MLFVAGETPWPLALAASLQGLGQWALVARPHPGAISVSRAVTAVPQCL